MTLTQLRYVIAVAESKSMNEASKQLFVSQPSLSSAIKELEAETGVEIFRRSNKGVVITPEGEEFIGYARQVVEQYKLIETKYIEKSNEKKKFAVSTQHYTFAVNAFVQMVKQFGMNEYEFAIRETKTYEVIEDVKNFKSEIGILYINEFNKKVLFKLFSEYGLTFHPILDCSNSFYFAEEVLSTYNYKQLIKANDRATLLNLMVGLNGYTLCSGIICEELNGSDYCAVRLKSDEIMTIGYLSRKGAAISSLGQKYIEELSLYKDKALR